MLCVWLIFHSISLLTSPCSYVFVIQPWFDVHSWFMLLCANCERTNFKNHNQNTIHFKTSNTLIFAQRTSRFFYNADYEKKLIFLLHDYWWKLPFCTGAFQYNNICISRYQIQSVYLYFDKCTHKFVHKCVNLFDKFRCIILCFQRNCLHLKINFSF